LFTLIELLVVIAIIAILASLLLPALQEAKAKARQVSCMASLSQVAIAVAVYQDEWDEYYPQNSTVSLPAYMDYDLLRYGCPERGEGERIADRSYGINQLLTGCWSWKAGRLAQATTPSRTCVFIGSCYSAWYSPTHWEYNTLYAYHSQPGRHRWRGLSFSFVDGHVEWLKAGFPDGGGSFPMGEWRHRTAHATPQHDTIPPCSLGGCLWHPY